MKKKDFALTGLWYRLSDKVNRWKKSHHNELGMILDTYGFCLTKLGRNEEAEKSIGSKRNVIQNETFDC
jgi:hypothetical protein